MFVNSQMSQNWRPSPSDVVYCETKYIALPMRRKPFQYSVDNASIEWRYEVDRGVLAVDSSSWSLMRVETTTRRSLSLGD